nr:thioredoxin family protein [Desulfoscipio geothermicus]
MDNSFATGKPVAVILTYDADCCPDTKKFFDEHRATTQEIEKKYGEKVSFAWIDIAIYDQLEHDKLMEVAEELNVNSVPAVVLLDNNRKVIKSWIGELNQEEVSQAIEQVVN